MDNIKYKSINLKLSEKVFKDVKKSLLIRKIADNSGGLHDQLLIKIIKFITDNEKEVSIEYKEERLK